MWFSAERHRLLVLGQVEEEAHTRGNGRSDPKNPSYTWKTSAKSIDSGETIESDEMQEKETMPEEIYCNHHLFIFSAVPPRARTFNQQASPRVAA